MVPFNFRFNIFQEATHAMFGILVLPSAILAQAAAAAAGAQPAPSPMSSFLLPMGFMVVAMYFLMIAPQRKKQKAHDKMVAELKTGDEVVTTGGIYGTVTNVKADRFVIKVSDSTKIEVGKGFITSVVPRSDGSDK